MKKLWRKFLCWIGDHEWTSAAMEGVKPTEKQLTTGLNGFAEYSTMYCKHCGYISSQCLFKKEQFWDDPERG